MQNLNNSHTSHNSTNHDTRFIVKNNCAHSISLAARNDSVIGGSLNGVVCAHVTGNGIATVQASNFRADN